MPTWLSSGSVAIRRESGTTIVGRPKAARNYRHALAHAMIVLYSGTPSAIPDDDF